MTVEFTIGCDPEVFVTKRGKPSSAYGLLQGTKENPFRTEGGAYQVDGMAAEFNTDPVPIVNRWGGESNSFESWNTKIITQLRTIREALPDGHSLRIAPTMEFGKDFIEKQPREARELGCDPDYSAYTLKPNPRPNDEATFRSGAGHIHTGWGADIPVDNEDHIKICAGFVKMMDATVGLFMTYVDRDPLRRELYGKAGAMRPKPYGVEYRTPSNVWVQNRDMRLAVWTLTSIAIRLHKAGISVEQCCGFANVEEVINTGDHAKAKEGLEKIFQHERRYLYAGRNELPGYMARIVSKMDKIDG